MEGIVFTISRIWQSLKTENKIIDILIIPFRIIATFTIIVVMGIVLSCFGLYYKIQLIFI